MERLTIEQIEDIVDDLRTFDFLPVGRDGREQYEQICKGAEQMRDELLAYKKLEESIGCPLKVYVQLKADKKIYVQVEGKIIPMNIQTTHRGVLDLYRCNEVGDFSCRIEKFNNYKKSWWLKADRSE